MVIWHAAMLSRIYAIATLRQASYGLGDSADWKKWNITSMCPY